MKRRIHPSMYSVTHECAVWGGPCQARSVTGRHGWRTTRPTPCPTAWPNLHESTGVAGIMQKLYCYLDETGQDTQGRLFVVAAVITGDARDSVRRLLERLEYVSGKGQKKWSKATRAQRQAYMTQVLQAPALHARLFYGHFRQTTTYLPCVLHTAAHAVTTVAAGADYRATVLIDGLPREERFRVGAGLRQLQVAVRRVRGLRDESDAFIRLADAVAGFVRRHLEGHADVTPLFENAVRRQVLREV